MSTSTQQLKDIRDQLQRYAAHADFPDLEYLFCIAELAVIHIAQQPKREQHQLYKQFKRICDLLWTDPSLRKISRENRASASVR